MFLQNEAQVKSFEDRMKLEEEDLQMKTRRMAVRPFIVFYLFVKITLSVKNMQKVTYIFDRLYVFL